MKEIRDFFGKFRNKALEQVRKHSIVAEAIKKHTGIEVDIKDISISNGKATIKSSQTSKNEIYIKKEKILMEIREVLGNSSINEIN